LTRRIKQLHPGKLIVAADITLRAQHSRCWS
jgi:hypothetical protein